MPRHCPYPQRVGGPIPHPPCLPAGKPWGKVETPLPAEDPPGLALAATHSSLASKVVR